jgi:hypothetical protein
LTKTGSKKKSKIKKIAKAGAVTAVPVEAEKVDAVLSQVSSAEASSIDEPLEDCEGEDIFDDDDEDEG